MGNSQNRGVEKVLAAMQPVQIPSAQSIASDARSVQQLSFQQSSSSFEPREVLEQLSSDPASPDNASPVHTSQVLDPALRQELKTFVYHEPQLVEQISQSMQELVAIADSIKTAKESIKTTTDDLMHTYQQTLAVFRNRSTNDPNMKTAISILQESIELQDTVSEGFMTSADSIYHAVNNKLKPNIDKITVPVLGKHPK
ncbi:hypothetical protein C0J52_23644 [Blattella germanica]|nr:hypothetical protein C0J52_23644 [Blattella germanica]